MLPREIIGQIISIAAMGCNILSYQNKNQKSLLLFQLLGGTLFAISFFLLGATIGAILNLIAVVRAVMFLFSDKLKMSHPLWLAGFIAVYITVYVLNFAVFGTEPRFINFAIEMLPVIGMTALSVGFMFEDSSKVRMLGLVSSPAWLIYNIYYLSVGAIVCESLSLISIFIGMLRHDKKPATDVTEDLAKDSTEN